MKDALRSKINVILVAAVAFTAGLGIAAELGVTQESTAADVQEAALQLGASSDQARKLADVDFRNGFAPIVDEISGAVVTIQVEKQVSARGRGFDFPDDFFPFPRRREQQPEEPRLREGSGSGFIIDESGYIVTNNHVVQGAENVTVQLADRRQFDDVELVGRDPQTDVALLKVDAEELGSVPLGNSGDLRVGEWVLAIGSPGFDSPGGSTVLPSTITAGIVSAKGRSINILNRGGEVPLAIEDFIQTDAVINRGNSGGPLVNMRGEVVGMNTAIMSETGTYQGYGFAVPTSLIRQVVEDLMRYGEVRRAVLGVAITSVDAADARYFGLDQVRGVEVGDFSPLAEGRSPAEEAGVQRGDVILSVDGEEVVGVSDLQTQIRGYEPGETVTLGIARRADGETRRIEIDVELAAAQPAEEETQQASAAPAPDNPLGVQVEPLDTEIRRELELPDEVTGVIVTDHAGRRSPLATALGGGQLFRYTIITEIDGTNVEGMESYREAVSALEPGALARIQLFNGNPQSHNFTYVTVEIPENGG
jgi:Do/DeqQ family serine protease